MAPNQKNESPEPNQAQGGPDESGVEQQEPARQCKVCNGPNHHACGCEARQLREAEEGSAMNHDRGEQQPESKIDTADFPERPEPQPALDWFHQKLTEEEREMAQRLYDNFENISVSLMDTVNLLNLIFKQLLETVKLLQVISSDAMATRELLQKMEAKMNNAKDTNKN